MEVWVIWLIVATLLVIIEVLTQMVWTLCIAIGCIIALLLSILGVDLAWQLISVGAASVVAFIWLVPVLRRWHDENNRHQNRDDRTGMEALLGRRAIVTEDIRPGRLGRARIDGDNWQVCSSSDEIIFRGSEVVVTSYDSIILHVQIVNPK